MKKTVKRFLEMPRYYLFNMRLRPFMVRYFFLSVCIVGLMWHAVYTNYIIGRLRKDADDSTRMYARLISAALFDKMGKTSEKIILEEVIESFDIPIIITTTDWKPVIWKNIFTGLFFNRKEIDPDDTSPDARAILEKKIQKFKKKFAPKNVYGRDLTTVMGYLVYGSSSLLSGLVWLPFYEGVFIILFSAFVYFALHNIMITERSNLWVGLAKETAHQLGTPISSLMGWVEYMRTVKEADTGINPEMFIDQVHGICDDMQKDLTRLKKIASRFGQIGSKPTLQLNDINDILEENVRYFRTRLPMLGKRIEIKNYYADMPEVPLNRDLIEWVLENLFKNSVDAIQKSEGLIEIKPEFLERENIVRIHHIDNGRGISWDEHKNVFSPGYTTKTRGWGLGLTLAKRIIEDYHNGHIYVSWSQKGEGTAFCIDLPVNNPAVAAR